MSKNNTIEKNKRQSLMRIMIAVWAVFRLSSPLWAQQTTQGTDFYITFGQNMNLTTSQVDLQLRIVTSQTTGVTGTYAGDPSLNFTTVIPANSVYTRVLTQAEKNMIYCDTAGIFLKSLRIETDKDVSVFILNQYGATSDASNVLPVSNWGSDYYYIGYTPVTSAIAKSGYTVVAHSNGTIVEEDGIQVAVLNQAESYTALYSDMDITGKHVSTNHPVAYFSFNTAAQVVKGTESIDCLFQQLAPVNVWGYNFLAPVSVRGKERIRVVASQNNTVLTLSGGVVQITPGKGLLMLNAGEFVEIEINLLSGGCFISATKPVMVASFMMGRLTPGLAHAYGDPSMAWIPPVEQSVLSALITPFIPATSNTQLTDHWALIVTPTATRDSTQVSVNGNIPVPLSGSYWATGNGSGSFLSFYSYKLDSGNVSYQISNPAGLTVLGYGLGQNESYYYLAAAAARDLDLYFTVNNIYYKDIDGDSLCGNPFRLEAFSGLPLSTAQDRIKWLVDGVEDTSARDLTYVSDKWIPSGTHTLTLQVRDYYNYWHELETAIRINCLRINPDSTRTYINVPKEIRILSNDAFLPTCTPQVKIIVPPGHGTAVVFRDTLVRYTPESDFLGKDSLTYLLICGNDSAWAQVHIAVLEKMSITTALSSLCENGVDTFHITVRNQMSETAHGVSITEIPPSANVHAVHYTASKGTYSGNIWDAGSLEAGDSAVLTLIMQGTNAISSAPYFAYISSENGNTYSGYDSAVFKRQDSLSVFLSPKISTTSDTLMCLGFPIVLFSLSDAGTPPWQMDYHDGHSRQSLSLYSSPYVFNPIAVGKYYFDSIIVTGDNGCQSALTASAVVQAGDTPVVGNIVLDTMCSGGNLMINGYSPDNAQSYPVMNLNYSPVTGSGWQIETGVNTNLYRFFDNPFQVTQADNGKRIRFFVATVCGDTIYSNATPDTLNGNPVERNQINILSVQYSSLYDTICEGDSRWFGNTYYRTQGIYYDTLMAANGCDSILAFYLTVIPPSYTVQTRTICQGDSLLFGSLFLKTEGIYYDTLVSLYANGCDSIVTLHLRVGGRFTVTPHITDDPCSDVKSAVSLTFSDGIAPYSCLWNTGKTTATIDSLDAGTYTAVIADSIGCKAEYAVTFVKNSLSVSYTATAAHCGQADGSITLLITSDSTDYSINWGHIAMPAVHGGKTAYNLLPGVYPITVSDSLCVRNMQISIENLPPPVACFTATYKKDDFDEPLAVSNCSENGTGYVWDFGDGSSSTEIEPLYWYTDFGTYTILLTVYDDFGCLDTAALEIQLTERSVCYIPNTFTPNGDGLNDIFIPICRNIRTHDYVFTIYDRWGNRIFASHNPDQGWDGTINGDPVASGNVYSWTLTYQDEFNNLQAQQGSITILR